MTQNANATWTDPTQSGLTALELAIQVVPTSGEPPAYTVLDSIAPGVQKAQVPDLADGEYNLRLVSIYGTNRSPGVVVQFTVDTPASGGNTPPPPTSFADATGFAVALS